MNRQLSHPQLNILRRAVEDGICVLRPHNASTVYSLVRRNLLSTPSWDRIEGAMVAHPMTAAVDALRRAGDPCIEVKVRRAGMRRMAAREGALARVSITEGSERYAYQHAVAAAHAAGMALSLEAGA